MRRVYFALAAIGYLAAGVPMLRHAAVVSLFSRAPAWSRGLAGRFCSGDGFAVAFADATWS